MPRVGRGYFPFKASTPACGFASARSSHMAFSLTVGENGERTAATDQARGPAGPGEACEPGRDFGVEPVASPAAAAGDT